MVRDFALSEIPDYSFKPYVVGSELEIIMLRDEIEEMNNTIVRTTENETFKFLPIRGYTEEEVVNWAFFNEDEEPSEVIKYSDGLLLPLYWSTSYQEYWFTSTYTNSEPNLILIELFS